VLTHDAGRATRWAGVTLKATILPRTRISISARASRDKGHWSPWRGDFRALPAGRYLQLRVTLSTRDRSRTPILDRITLRAHGVIITVPRC
jgi:hypothetical protein